MKPLLAGACMLLAGTVAQADQPLLVLVGDSTMAPRTGYGNALCERLDPALACLNLARGGRSTLSYRAEGLWDRVLARLRAMPPGTPAHVLIQFGHNDQPGKPGRSTDLATEFPANLARYVQEARAAGGTPVLVTPLVRRSFRGDRLVNDLQPWADAVRRVAREQAAALVDLNELSGAEVQRMGEADADLLAMAPKPPPGDTAPQGPNGYDRTHVGARGACVFATLMAGALAQAVPPLKPQLRTGGDCAGPWPPAPLPRLNRATYDVAGWAVGTIGGQGGRIERVTTLAAGGPGSLRAAVEAPGARTVVFEVGGVIDLAGRPLKIRHPFLTIAGQTAPHPGITLVRGETTIGTHDVIVQHLMFRPGEAGAAKRSGADMDGLSTTGGAHQVIVDHCSFSWATDENLSVGGPRFEGADATAWRRNTSHDITYSNNLVYEGLSNSVHEKGEHSKGTLVHDNAGGILLLGNVYASNRERNALFKGGVHAAMVNNLVYNPGRRAVHYNLIAHEWAGRDLQTGQVALVGIVLRHGPDTTPGTPLFTLGGVGDVELHLADNLAVDDRGQPVDLAGRYTQSAARVLPATTPYLPPDLRAVPAATLEATLPLTAGARPWDRDPVDFKLLSDVAEGMGRIIDSESDGALRGYPSYAPTRRPFDPAAWKLSDMSPRAGWDSLWATPGR